MKPNPVPAPHPGYSLSEVDHVIFTTQLVKGTFMNVGIFFHLRDANGKNVLVKAGAATFDATEPALASCA